MNFDDVIKKIFVDDFFNIVSFPKMIICLGITFVIGILIYLVYRVKNKTEIYSSEFNIVLLVLPIITCAIVISLHANLYLSLGMVGALSIVRFRNAVKSSMDLLFLFWAISVGIICGGEIYSLAIVLSLILSIVLLISDLFPSKCMNSLLVVNGNNNLDEKELMKIVAKYTNKYKVKSKSINKDSFDLIIEVRGKNIDKIISECTKINEIENINLVYHDGNVRL